MRTADGRRAFVKAVSSAQNEHSPRMHRQEAVVTAADLLAEDFAGWHRIRADPPADLDPWVARHLDELCELAERGLAALAGDTLVHLDIRADNLLLSPDGTVTVIADALLAAEVDLAAVLAGLGAFFADAARQPAPAGLPTLRAFQQAQADTVLSWLRALR